MTVFDSEVFLTLRFNIFQTNNGSMLPVMYLQADNSAKDNKKKVCHHLCNGREGKYPEESKFNASYLVKLRKP